MSAALANAVIAASLSHCRSDFISAQQRGSARYFEALSPFLAGIAIGKFQCASAHMGGDPLAAMAADNEVMFMLRRSRELLESAP